MVLGGLLKGLFGGGAAKEAGPAKGEPVAYKDYTITPTPLPQGGQFLTAGTIAKDYPDGRKEHRFIRADTHSSAEDASRLMVQKAQRLIDELGDRLFG